jgi:large subunit ribosomal protein L10
VNRAEKQQQVESLRRQMEGVDSAFLLTYSGLTVNQVNELRAKVRKSSSVYKVLKNRIAARALEGTPLAPLKEQLRGPLAIAFHPKEPVALAKVLSDFAKDNPALVFRAGLVEGRPMAAGELAALAALPTREVLMARLLGSLTAPLAAFQRALLAPVRDFAAVLDQIARKQKPG